MFPQFSKEYHPAQARGSPIRKKRCKSTRDRAVARQTIPSRFGGEGDKWSWIITREVKGGRDDCIRGSNTYKVTGGGVVSSL